MGYTSDHQLGRQRKHQRDREPSKTKASAQNEAIVARAGPMAQQTDDSGGCLPRLVGPATASAQGTVSEIVLEQIANEFELLLEGEELDLEGVE